jgi:nucleoside-diphosphate-sugar epimerase
MSQQESEMRVLIVGGTGFIGPRAVRRLAEAGHEVMVFHRGEHEPELPSTVRHVHSASAASPVVDFPGELRDFGPEVVLHMMLLGEQDAQAVMSAFRGIARRVVAISSADVYRAYDILRRKETRPPDPVPLGEDAPLREQLYPYRGMIERLNDYDKILAERIVTSNADLPGTVLRLPFVYGPDDRQHRFFPYLKRMDDGRPMILLGERQARWRSSWGYVENMGEAIALACTDDRAAGRIYNVAEEPAPVMADWVRRIGDLAGWRGSVVTAPESDLPSQLARDYNWDQHLVLDTARIRRELGYREPVTLDEAVQRTIEWERAHPPEQIDPQEFDYDAEDAVLARASTV